MITETWFIFNPKSNELEKIKFEGIPKNSGYIFLRFEKNNGKYTRGANFDLYSPFGELIRSGILQNYNDAKDLERGCNKKLKELQKMAHGLSTQND